MPDYQLRQMQDDDLPEVISMIQAAGEYPWTAAKIRDSLNSQMDSCYLLLGQDRKAVLAYAVIKTVLDEYHLLDIVVRKERQGKGLGHYLLKSLIGMARTSNMQTVYLEVRCSNKAAIQLYEKLGFVKDGVRKAYYPKVTGREDAWLYSLSFP